MDEATEYGGYLAAERLAFSEELMRALWDAMPWGLEVNLGAGRKAVLTQMGAPKLAPIYRDAEDPAGPGEIVGHRPAAFICDFRCANMDNDHVEVRVEVSGGGGFMPSAGRKAVNGEEG